MNATRSARSESDSNGFACRKNSAVSTTVIGASITHYHYTQSAHGKQE